MMRCRSFTLDPFTVMRKRMLRETEVALLYGLRFPNRIPRIPVMEVGRGEWHPLFAERFWREALGIDDCGLGIDDCRLRRGSMAK